jgi:hypothetical protein
MVIHAAKLGNMLIGIFQIFAGWWGHQPGQLTQLLWAVSPPPTRARQCENLKYTRQLPDKGFKLFLNNGNIITRH